MDVAQIVTMVVYLSNIAFVLFIVFKSNKSTRSALLWIMVAALLPGISIILYSLIGQDFKKQQLFHDKEDQDRALRDMTTQQMIGIDSKGMFFKNPKNYQFRKLITLNLNSDDAIFTQDNEIETFFWGEDKFNSLLEDIKNAKESIEMQYYIFKYDGIGEDVLKALEKKLEEGVRVRLLVDGIGGRYLNRKEEIFKNFKKLGGEFAIFFPSFLNVNMRINYRNHRKIVIIDDKIGYIGGFNVGDEYLGKYEKFGLWRDTHIRICGNAIYGLKSRFIKDWYYAKGEDIRKEPDIKFYEEAKGDIGVQILTSGPDTDKQNIKNTILELVNVADKRIVIQTPYFIPDETLMDALTNALLSHVQVDIMIPHMPDHPLVYWATTSYAAEMMSMGANLYIYEKGFLHSKVINVDDYLTFVGSANFDNRSFSLNFEANALIYDKKTTENFLEQFEKDKEDSVLMTEEMYKNRPFIQKVKEPISRLFSPLL